MPSGAAAEENEAVELAEIDGAEVESAEFGGGAIFGETTAHGVFKGGGLLEDLLLHEMRVAVELGGIDGPGDLIHNRGDILHVEGRDEELLGGDVDNFAVFQVNDVLRAADEGGDVGREDVFIITHAEDERGSFAGGDDLVGGVAAEHGDAVGALDVAKGLAHGVDEAALAGGGGGLLGVVVGDQV